ncbi:MAG: type II toxin-antitoxin system VapC family toxin [Anaerolineales bacterium]
MRVLFDTNIILDLFLDRDPFADHAAALWRANTEGRLNGFVSVITPVNLFYIGCRLQDRATAFQAVKEVLAVLSVCYADHTTLQTAWDLHFQDYEDAFQHASAASNELDAIVTRNLKDFTNATLPIFSPPELLSKLTDSSPQG